MDCTGRVKGKTRLFAKGSRVRVGISRLGMNFHLVQFEELPENGVFGFGLHQQGRTHLFSVRLRVRDEFHLFGGRNCLKTGPLALVLWQLTVEI